MAVELIGRRSEVESARAFLEGVTEGPAILRIEGEAGIGKTAVLEAVVRAVEDRGWGTLRVAATEAEAEFGFAGLDALLADVPESTFAGLAPPLRRAIEVALLRVDPGRGGTDFRAVGVALAAVLDIASRDGPLLIAIDDWQWLDPATTRVLDLALRRLGRRPVRLVTTLRTDALGEAMTRDRGEDADRGTAMTIRLGGMSLAALRALLEARTGIALGRSSLTRLEAVSAGNPLLALEIVSYLQRRGRDIRVDELVPVPSDLLRLVTDRLATLQPESRDLLEVAAVIGRPDVERLALVADRSVVERALPAGVDAGLIRLDGRTVQFLHPMFASALYAAMTETHRQELHCSLAGRLPDPVESASHLAHASVVPDPAVADRLAAAAELAASRGAPDVAASLLSDARRLTPPDDAAGGTIHRSRALALARILWEIGEVDRSAALAADVEAQASPGQERAAVRLLRARQLAWTVGPAAAVAIAEAALADAGADPLLSAQIHLRLAYNLDDDLAAAAGHIDAALAALADTEPGAAADVLAAASLFDQEVRLRRGRPVLPGELATARGLLASLPDAGDRTLDAGMGGFAREREFLILERLDDLVGARDTLRGMIREDEAVGRDRALVVAHADLAELESWLGHADAARAEANLAAELAEQTGRTPHAQVFVATARAAVGLLTGELEAADDAVKAGLGIVPPPAAESWVRLVAMRGSVALALGRPADAIEAFAAAASALEAAGLAHPSMYRFRGDAVEALVLAGAVDAAEAAVNRLEAAGSGLGSAWVDVIVARSRGLVAAARGDLDPAVAWLEQALGRHAALPMPVELGRSQLLLGQVRRRRKEKRLADEALRAALATFESAGALGWATRTRSELDRVGLRPRAPATLTPTEMQVARLAASGLTNRQVADAVILSPKTIDGVLARAYAKLGIRSRAELGARIAELRDAHLAEDREH